MEEELLRVRTELLSKAMKKIKELIKENEYLKKQLRALRKGKVGVRNKGIKGDRTLKIRFKEKDEETRPKI